MLTATGLPSESFFENLQGQQRRGGGSAAGRRARGPARGASSAGPRTTRASRSSRAHGRLARRRGRVRARNLRGARRRRRRAPVWSIVEVAFSAFFDYALRLALAGPPARSRMMLVDGLTAAFVLLAPLVGVAALAAVAAAAVDGAARRRKELELFVTDLVARTLCGIALTFVVFGSSSPRSSTASRRRALGAPPPADDARRRTSAQPASTTALAHRHHHHDCRLRRRLAVHARGPRHRRVHARADARAHPHSRTRCAAAGRAVVARPPPLAPPPPALSGAAPGGCAGALFARLRPPLAPSSDKVLELLALKVRARVVRAADAAAVGHPSAFGGARRPRVLVVGKLDNNGLAVTSCSSSSRPRTRASRGPTCRRPRCCSRPRCRRRRLSLMEGSNGRLTIQGSVMAGDTARSRSRPRRDRQGGRRLGRGGHAHGRAVRGDVENLSRSPRPAYPSSARRDDASPATAGTRACIATSARWASRRRTARSSSSPRNRSHCPRERARAAGPQARERAEDGRPGCDRVPHPGWALLRFELLRAWVDDKTLLDVDASMGSGSSETCWWPGS